MPTLVSPGTSVSLTDESFYIPASSTTVPLFIVATAENKTQPDGISVAIGTVENHVIRTVTSIPQSTQLYGIPRFLETVSGEPLHGDCRNEYGILALNQFMGVGNKAYVVRANVNLNDDRNDILALWSDATVTAANNLQALAQTFISEFNTANGYISSNPLYKVTITRSELLALISEVMLDVYKTYNFNSTVFKNDFYNNHTVTPLSIYNANFTAVVGTYLGIQGSALDWENNSLGATPTFENQWTPVEAQNFLLDASDDYAYTVQFLNSTSLGANDSARRSAIVTALQAAANLPELRAEAFEFNLVLCPGYYEVTDELVTLVTDIGGEAMVIGETPMNRDPQSVVTWADSSSLGRVKNNLVAYYYGHGLTSNLDGREVLAAASGIAARTIAYSDNNSQVWFAPAGANRGVVTGITQMGYFTGTPGTATTFVEAVLNVGQRDNLYKDGTNINPITFVPGRGIIVMGQKTSALVSSALDRVNVIRLLALIKRSLRKGSFPFVFEPNDQLTRDNLKAMVDGFLSDIVTKRGLYDFATQCDAINNSPSVVDRNELICDVALKPVRAAEFIYIPIRVVSTGAEL